MFIHTVLESVFDISIETMSVWLLCESIPTDILKLFLCCLHCLGVVLHQLMLCYLCYFDSFNYKYHKGCVDILVFSSQPSELP